MSRASGGPSSSGGLPAGVGLGAESAQISEDFALELLDRLAKSLGEGTVAIHHAAVAEVVEHDRQAVARHQVVGHQERELVGLQRAVALMPQRELARRAQRGEVEAAGREPRMLASAV